MKLQGNIKQYIVKVILLMLLISNIGIMLLLYLGQAVKETNTISYYGTIKSVNVTELNNGIDIRIYTNEYNGPVFVSSSITKYIDINELKELEKKEYIYFKVDRNKYNPEDSLFVEAVELATEEKSIFTLEDYNLMKEKSLLFLKIIIAIYTVIIVYVAYKLFSKKQK